MRILGLDISTKSTGWFLDKRFWGIIAIDTDLSFGDKLVFFRKELSRILQKYKPDVVVIEDAYYRPRAGSIHTLKTLVKFAGVAIELAHSLGIQVEVITATTARKNCCGSQEKDFKKEAVFEYFKNKYKMAGWEFNKHNDVTDAAALVWGYREISKQTSKN